MFYEVTFVFLPFFFFFFWTVLFLWLNRFWPWVVLAKQFHIPTLSALFHLTLPLRHACASRLSKGSSSCLQMLSSSDELPPSDLGPFFSFSFFSPFASPLGHPESTSRGHHSDLCTMSAHELLCLYSLENTGQQCAKIFSGWCSCCFSWG